MVKEIKDSEYKELVKNNKKVVIDCYAPWCGPCKMISPVIDKISEEINDTIFYKINIDNAEEIVKDYSIMSIPTILIFEDNKLKDKVIGFRSKEELVEKINN